jgi:Protein of unknown function (DUF2917)
MSHTLMQSAQHWTAPADGWLAITAGRAWITRRGDGQDHVLAAGHRLRLTRGDDVVLERWQRDASVTWRWEGDPARPHYRGVRAVLLRRGLAAVLRGAAAGLAALARSAAAMAERAQGCIKAGESMASSGTVQ